VSPLPRRVFARTAGPGVFLHSASVTAGYIL
jgi:hypothetical protein